MVSPDTLDGLLAHLPAPVQTVLRMSYGEGARQSTIATRLSLPPKQVARLIADGLRAIAARLESLD